MTIVLHRVDERLIHGQVVVGWGGHLQPHRYVVVDDELVASQWEQDLYTLGVPDGTEVEFVTAREARLRLPGWRDSEEKTVVLTRDLPTVLKMATGGSLKGVEVNLGGLHQRTGREEVLPYLFLDDEDRSLLQELADEGVLISAQDLPGSHKVGLESLLG